MTTWIPKTHAKILTMLEGVFHVSEFEIHFRPQLAWELREEFLYVEWTNNSIIVGVIDPEFEKPFHSEKIFPSGFDVGRVKEMRIMQRHLNKYIDEISRIENPYLETKKLNNYILSKWIDRPENAYLAQLALERHTEKNFVLKVAKLIGPSAFNVCKNILAGTELVK